MASPCVNHVAVQVSDFDAYLAFFTQDLGMEVTLTDPASGEKPWRQAWVGGIQLQRVEAFEQPLAESRMSHIGIEADDVEAVLEAAYARPEVVQAEGHERNWFVFDDTVMIEVVPRD